MTDHASTEDGFRSPVTNEVHLCDNYSHLVFAAADLAGREPAQDAQRLLLFIDDALPLGERLHEDLTDLTGADIVRVSDLGAIERFSRLPRFVPAMLRRNLSSRGWRLIRPRDWSPEYLVGRSFERGYVYHPGFFLSKVVAGHCLTVVMRDSGYANYVRHRVPLGRALPRLLAGRSPLYQTWGEEPWVDAIEVVRPDQLPPRSRHKATELTLDTVLARLPPETSRALATAFWDAPHTPTIPAGPVALLLTQPIDLMGICSTAERTALYQSISDRLRDAGFEVVTKAHPREPASGEGRSIPSRFPIEAWNWLGLEPFDLAVSLNSTSLSADRLSFARERLQLLPPELFYRRHWHEWPEVIGSELNARFGSGRPRPTLSSESTA